MSGAPEGPWITTLAGDEAVALLGSFCASPLVVEPHGEEPWRRLEFLLAGTAALRDGAALRMSMVRFRWPPEFKNEPQGWWYSGRLMLLNAGDINAMERAGWRANTGGRYTVFSVMFRLVGDA